MLSARGGLATVRGSGALHKQDVAAYGGEITFGKNVKHESIFGSGGTYFQEYGLFLDGMRYKETATKDRYQPYGGLVVRTSFKDAKWFFFDWKIDPVTMVIAPIHMFGLLFGDNGLKKYLSSEFGAGLNLNLGKVILRPRAAWKTIGYTGVNGTNKRRVFGTDYGLMVTYMF